MSLILVNLQSLTQEAIKGFKLSLDKTGQDCVLFFTNFTLSKLNVRWVARVICLLAFPSTHRYTYATTTLDFSKPHQVLADPFSFYLLVNVIDIF